MRWIVGILGLLVGAVVTGLAARYGYATSDREIDGYIMGFVFGTVTAFGIAGPVIGLRLWRARHRIISALTYALSFAALVLSFSNTLGAIAGRSDVTATERSGRNQAVETARAEIKRLDGLRASMAAFVPTDATAVAAAKTAADAALASREAECARRGPLCRDREADERRANDRFAEASANKAATDRAMQLEGAAESHRVELGRLGSTVVVNVQGNTFAKLMRWDAAESDFAAVLQNLGLAIMVEMIVMVCLLQWEALGPDRRVSVAAPVELPVELVKVELEPAPQTPTIAPNQSRKAIQRPQSLESRAFSQIMTALLEPAEGQRVTIPEAYQRYAEASKAFEGKALEKHEFLDVMKAFCKAGGIPVVIKGQNAFLVGVQFAVKNNKMIA